MKSISTILLISLFTLNLVSQEVVLFESVKADTIIEKQGQNRKHYTHSYMGFGVILGNSEGAGSDINYWSSSNFEFGFRYKYKICNYYALGLLLNYNMDLFNIKQESGKTFPDTLFHKKERLTINNVGIGVYNRFNFGKRGNIIGKYIDLGAFGDLRFFAEHFTKDKSPNKEIVRVSTSRLNYIEPISYGIFANFGINRYSIYAKYRLSDLFDKTFGYTELPRFTAGVQIGFFK